MGQAKFGLDEARLAQNRALELADLANVPGYPAGSEGSIIGDDFVGGHVGRRRQPRQVGDDPAPSKPRWSSSARSSMRYERGRLKPPLRR
jgi:hypothetical protein